MYPNCLHFVAEVRIKGLYFRNKVYSIWAHGCLGNRLLEWMVDARFRVQSRDLFGILVLAASRTVRLGSLELLYPETPLSLN